MKIFTKEWFKKGNKTAEELEKMYEDYRRASQESGVFESLRQELHLHDTVVKEIAFAGDTLTISFYKAKAISCVLNAVFSNVQIQTNDGIDDGDWWLYEELYANTDRYELHILFCDAQEKPKELVFTFDEVILRTLHKHQKDIR